MTHLDTAMNSLSLSVRDAGRKRWQTIALYALIVTCGMMLLWQTGVHADDTDANGDPKGQLYAKQGEDPTFESLMKRDAIPVGRNSTDGIRGSRINVHNGYLDRLRQKERAIPEAIHIHTIGNSLIPRKDFDKWSRWYQEDGNTQIFRMFEGEHNVRNERPGAGRIEAFTELKWGRGDWHAWEGMYTIVKPHRCMIFQVKNRENDWGVAIMMSDEGDIKVNHRRGQDDLIVARNMTGKSFLLGIRDNGHDYEVYFNRKKVAEGSFNRPKGKTNFRWGMYGGTFRHDAMIFVTGVRYE